MDIFWAFVIGIAVGIAAAAGYRGFKAERSKEKAEKSENESFNDIQKREKEAAKEAVLELFEIEPRLTNDFVEKHLGVSDSTATRYFDELEEEGKIRQVGDTGSGVYYVRI